MHDILVPPVVAVAARSEIEQNSDGDGQKQPVVENEEAQEGHADGLCH